MTVIAGADIAILSDISDVPFILDRDLLDDPESVLTPTDDVMAPLECEVLTARWKWGAEEWLGPLTKAEAGSAEVVLRDPQGDYDPANPAIRPITPNRPIAILVDGVRAWSGWIVTVAHERSTDETRLSCEDGIAVLARASYTGVTPAGSTFALMGKVLDAVQWPGSQRIAYGAPAGYRTAGDDPENAWEALQRGALAELGLVWIDRSGRVAYSARGWAPEVPTDAPRIGCGGADLEELESSTDRDSIRNHVLVEPDDTHTTVEWTDSTSAALYGRRTIDVKREELRLEVAP
jgi:hypothetical protein